MKNPILITLFFLFLYSCQKEGVDCPAVVELGKFFLTDNSKELFPYDLSESNLIFIDEVDTDVKANSSGNSPATTSTLIYNTLCKDDKSLEITLEAEIESINTTISFEALDKKFDLSLHPMIPGNYYTDKSLKGIDFMQISYYDSIQFQALPKHKAVITVLVDDRGGIMEYVPNTDQAISSLV